MTITPNQARGNHCLAMNRVMASGLEIWLGRSCPPDVQIPDVQIPDVQTKDEKAPC
jgi:hypothetical protein